MPGCLGGFEDHAAIERGSDADHLIVCSARIAVQFERSAPCRVPSRIEIHDQVEAPTPGLDWVPVEIDMRIKVLSFAVLVRAAAEIPRIVEQVIDAGDAADQLEKTARLYGIVQLRVDGPEFANTLDGRFVAEFAGLVARVAALERRKRIEHLLCGRCCEKVVDHDMPKRRRLREPLRKCGRAPGNTGVKQDGWILRFVHGPR